MSTNYTTDNPRRSSDGGRRRSRRGGRNRSNEGRSNEGRSSEGRSQQSSTSSRTRTSSRPPKKLSLFEKIIAFFTGGSKPEPAPARRSEPRAAEAKSSEPRAERAERTPKPPRTGMRKPESVEVTTPRLYVGNLSFDATESDLLDLFNGVGIVQNVEVVSNRQTQRSKGFAFVQMQTVDEAKRAVAELHDKEYMGRKLVVSGAKAADRRDDREESREEPREEQQAEESAQQPEQ